MANVISSLTYANTFGDWAVTTNTIVREVNDLGYQNWTKETGTLTLKGVGLGLQVSNNAVIAGSFQVTGVGSSATIQRNLVVQNLGTAYLENTTLSLVASGNVTAPNVISTNITATGNIFSSNVYVTSNITTANIVSTNSVYVSKNVTTSNLVSSSVYVTDNITTSNIVATGSVYVTTNITAANIVSTNVTATSNIFSSNVFVTSNITTSNIVATGSVYVTTNVTAANIVSTNVTASGNIFSSNSFVTSNVTTSNVVATGSVFVTSNITAANIVSTNVTATSNIFSSNVFVTNNISTSNIVATGSVYVTSNITAANIVSTNVTATSNIISSNVFVTNNISTSNIVATGSVFVTSNITAANIVSTNVTATSNIISSNVFVTSNITTSNIVATGSVYVTSNVRAANIVSTNVTASGNIFSSNVFVTSNITTSNIVATGIVTVSGNLGIGTNGPTQALDVVGSIKSSTLTSGRVTFAGASGLLTDSSSLTYDGTSLNVVGSIKSSTLTSGRVTFAGASGLLTDSSSFTYNGTNLSVNGATITGGGSQIAGGAWSVVPYAVNSVTIDNSSGATRFFATGTNSSTYGSYIWYGGLTTGTTSQYMTLDTTGNLAVTNNVSSANVVTSKLYVSGTTRLVGAANTSGDLGVGGNLYVPGNLYMDQAPASANINALTVGSGGLTVQGNFILSQPTIYNAPSFTLYGSAPITATNFARFDVYRTGSNASIRWSETDKLWAIANVNSGTYYRIVTDEYANGSSSSANSMTYATSYAVANANTFLQSYTTTSISTANTGLKSYGDATYFAKSGGTITGAVSISSGTLTTASPIDIASGGANNNSYTTGQVLQYNGSSFTSLANVTAFSATGSSTAIPIITTDAYGRVTALSTASISTTLGIAGTTGSGSVALASQTLSVVTDTPTIIRATALNQTITIGSQISGVTPQSYGTSTAIPVLTIDAYGRVTSASTTGISTTITLAGGSGSGSVSGGGTLTLNGSTGLTTSVSGSTYTLTNSGVTGFSTTLTGLSTSGSTGSVVLGGTLGVSSGGTGTTTSTGTGSVVLSISPTFTGTVSGISKGMVGLGSVDNTADANKSVLYATGAGTAGYAGTAGSAGSVTNATFYRQFTMRDDRSDGGDYSLANRPTGMYAISGAGTNGPGPTFLSLLHIANGSDVALQIAGGYTSDNLYFRGTSALQSGGSYTTWRTVIHNGNIASQSVNFATTAGSAPASDVYSWAKASVRPTYTATDVGLGSVTNESKATMFNNPTFTGTVSGVSKAMVGLSNVDNTADASKSVSFATSAGSAGSATTAGNITAYTINQSVGTGNAPTFTGLTINGVINATGSITAYYSDKRLKNITGKIQNALEKVNSISGVEYTQSELAEEYGYNDYKPQVGVIAQEIQSILPEAVCLAPFDKDESGNSKSGENYLTVQYEKLVPLLIEAIKELKAEVDELKKK